MIRYPYGVAAVLAFFVAAPVVVRAEDHMKKTVEHLEKAMKSAREGRAEGVVSHTEEAKKELIERRKENFDKLSDRDKSLYKRAFTTNGEDPDFHKLTSLNYEEKGQKRELFVPQSNPLHQFRKDVESGQLPNSLSRSLDPSCRNTRIGFGSFFDLRMRGG